MNRTRVLAAAGGSLAAATTAENAYALAQVRTAEATAAANVANAAKVTGLARLGSSLMALVGGPIGLTVAALGGLVLAMRAAGAEDRARAASIERVNQQMREQLELQRLVDQGRARNSEEAERLQQLELEVAAIGKLNAELGRQREMLDQLRGSTNVELYSAMSLAVGGLEERLKAANARLSENFYLMVTSGKEVPLAFQQQAEAARQYGEAAAGALVHVMQLVGAGNRPANGVAEGLLNQIETTEGLDEATLQLVERLEDQSRALTMTRVEVLEFQKAQALSTATSATAREELERAYNQLISATQATEAAAKADERAADAKRKLAEATEKAHRSIEQSHDAHAGLQRLLKEQAAQLGGPSAQAALRYADQLDAIADLEAQILALGPPTVEIQEAIAEARANAAATHTKELEENSEAYRQSIEDARRLEEILDSFENTGFAGLRSDIELVGEALREATDPEMVDRLQNALTQMNAELAIGTLGAFESVLGTVRSFQDEGSQGFALMEKGMAALSIVQDLVALKAAVSAVLTQGQGDPYSAWARMAAMAAAVAPFIASIGLTLSSFGGGGGGFAATGGRRQETQGTGTVLGDAEAKSESIANAVEITAEATRQLVAINRGMLNALRAMQAGISGAAASIARLDFGELDLGSAVSAPGDPLGSAILGSIFGGDQDLVDQGVIIRGGAFGAVARDPRASSYQTIETDGGWFSSDDIDDVLKPLGDAAATQIRLILTSIGDAVREGAVALGLDLEAVNAAIEAFRVEEIRISTMDLTGEEAQKELEAVFSAIFDDLAGHVVPFVDQFQRVGEGLGETLVRVATSVQVVQQGVARLGLAIDETDPERFAQISVALIEAAGGIDEFIDGMQSFVQAFAPEEFQFELLRDDLTTALEQVGLAVPDTREAMWELMQSLDATTEAGREQIATLLRLTATADAYYDHLEDTPDPLSLIDITDDLDTIMAGVSQALARPVMDWQAAAEELIDANARLLVTAEAAGASEAELAQIREFAADRLQALVDAQREAVADYEAFVSGFRTGLVATLTGIERQRTEALATADALARAAGMQGAAEQDLAQIHRWAAREIAAAIAQVRSEAQGIVDQLLEGSGTTLDERIAQLEASQQRQLEGINQVDQAAQAMYQRQLSALQGIQAWLDSQLLGDLSTLTPAERLAEATNQFNALADAAAAGDVDAMQQVQQLATQLLTMGRGHWASGEQYTALEAMVRGRMGELAGMDLGPAPGDGQQPTFQVTVSTELAELYAQREDQLAEREAAHRLELANQLAVMIGDIAEVTGLSLSEVAASLNYTLEQLVDELGINLDELTAGTVVQLASLAAAMNVSFQELVTELGVSMDDLTGETVHALAQIAQQQGIDLAELASQVGADLGTLADRQSLLNQALDLTVAGLPDDIRDQLNGPLDALRSAVTDADVNDAMAQLIGLSEGWPDEIRNQLAPYFEGIDPAEVVTELSTLSTIEDIAGDQLAELQGQSGILDAIRQNLSTANKAEGLPGYAVGTAYVPRTGPALLHEGEIVMPAGVSAWFRRVGLGGIAASAAAGTASDAELLQELRSLRELLDLKLGRMEERIERVEAATRIGSDKVSEQTRRVSEQLALGR